MSQEGAGRVCTVGSGQGHAERVWVVRTGQEDGRVRSRVCRTGLHGRVRSRVCRTGLGGQVRKTVGSGQGHAGRVWVVGSGQGHAGQVKKTVGSGQGHAGRVWVVRTGQEDGRVRSRACRTGLGGQDRSGRRSGHGGRKQNWSGGRLGQVGKTIWTGYEGGHQVRR